MRTRGLSGHDASPSDCLSGQVASRPARHGTPTAPSPKHLAPISRDHALLDMAAFGHGATTEREPALMWPSSIRPRRRSSRPLFAALLLFAVLLPHSAQAVQVTFDNCLRTNYKEHRPRHLQWEPLYVDAMFDSKNESHNLRVTVWGNVTGSADGTELPPPGDPRWSDPDDVVGKIQRQPDPKNPKSKATTLVRKVNVLTYEPHRNLSDFCTDVLEGGTCPLGPVFDDTAELPQMTLSHEFFSPHSFTTLAVNFLIINGDEAGTNIGCVSVPVTPDLGGIAWMLTFLPFVALLFVGVATVFAAVYSPWGTTDIFMWSSNHGRDVDLIRLVTPGFGDCLQYIQFATLTGALSLNYPGFYQPVASQVSWSTLMFNQSFVSNHTGRRSLVDGIYVTNSSIGLGRYSQLVGLGENEDVWPGMMIWLLVIIGSVLVLTQLAFLVRWVYRYIRSIPEEDLRSKNVPFSLGNVVRIVLHFFLLPVMTLSIFQLAIAADSQAYSVALAVVTVAVMLTFGVWLLRIITRAQPRSELFDDLSTVLTYGPLYNTYTDEAAGFAIVPLVLAILRGIAIGGLQLSGIAQIAILATAEVVLLLTLIYFRPFHRETSMNAYHAVFSILRLVSVLLMISFVPSLGVTEGPKGWIGYVILLIHGCVIVFGFLLNAVQTIVEVVARLLGAGGDDARGLTRGGLSKIFGMRQLSRRMTRRHHGPSRHSQLSTSVMIDTDQSSKQGYIMPSGHVRSGSAASIGGLMNTKHQRSSSAVDSLDIYPGAPGSSFTPTTPGETSQFSFLGSPNSGNRPPAAILDLSDPYYRPPRKRQGTITESVTSQTNRASIADSVHPSQSGGPLGDPADLAAGLSRGATPALHGAVPIHLAPRTDYSTREVDFYYGVRGPALNSERFGRRLGTGPADPTSPVATAQGWLRGLFSGKSKEKNKGFEVVRSARMPPSMQAGFQDNPEMEGAPVAMSTLKNEPTESDDEGTHMGKRKGPPRSPSLLDERGEPRNLEVDGDLDLDAPEIPRKSSKRHSGIDLSRTPSFNLVPPSSPPRGNKPPTLPFDRSDSLTHQSSVSSMDIRDDLAQMDVHRAETGAERPTSGVVPHHSINVELRPDAQVDLLGSSAEVLDAQYASSQGSAGAGAQTPGSQRSRAQSTPGSSVHGQGSSSPQARQS